MYLLFVYTQKTKEERIYDIIIQNNKKKTVDTIEILNALLICLWFL